MKKFSLFCLVLSFVFGSDYVITLDKLVYSYEKVKRGYLKQLKDNSFKDQFKLSHNFLADSLYELFLTDRVELFKRIEERRNFQLFHFVVGTINLIREKSESFHIWNEHLDPKTAPTMFFRRMKKFMRTAVCRGGNWSKDKEILGILLSIQKRFLHHHLGLEINQMQKVERRLKGYEFIYKWFDPDDNDFFIHLFYRLQLVASKNNGTVPNGLHERNLFKLFGVYYFHFFYFKWRKLDDKKIPPKLLIILLLRGIMIDEIFRFLNDTNSISLVKLARSSKVVTKIVDAYDSQYNTFLEISLEDLRASSSFFQFMQTYIESKDAIDSLGERNYCYIKTFCSIVPIILKNK